MDGLNENYQELANAVVERAVADYRMVLRNQPIEYGRTVTVGSCERFFRSEWCRLLTRVDGEYLISEVKKEYKDDRERGF